MKVLDLDRMQGIPVFGTLVWKPVRRELGVTAFGINAYTAAHAGDEVVEDHSEATLGHEEVYVVVSGHARFTVGGREVDAPAGTLVYLDDPGEQRSARAVTAGTTVLAVGGVPGSHEPSAWEYFFPALPHAQAGDWDRAAGIIRDAIAERGEHPVLLYQLACFDARRGRHEEAMAHLVKAAAGDERVREWARGDEDLESLRGDPRFPA